MIMDQEKELKLKDSQIEAMKAVLEGYEAQIQTFEELGKVEDVKVKLETLKAYEAFGTPEAIAELKKTNEELVTALEDVLVLGETFEELGGSEAFAQLSKELADKTEALNAYEELGTVADLDEILSVYESEVTATKVKELSHKYKVDESVVANLFGKLEDPADVVQVLESIKPAGIPAGASKTNENAPTATGINLKDITKGL
jgi:ribosomal protein S6